MSNGAALALAVAGVIVAYLVVDAITAPAPPPVQSSGGSTFAGNVSSLVGAIKSLDELYGKDDKPTADGATAGAVAAGQTEPGLWDRLIAGIDRLNASQEKY